MSSPKGFPVLGSTKTKLATQEGCVAVQRPRWFRALAMLRRHLAGHNLPTTLHGGYLSMSSDLRYCLRGLYHNLCTPDFDDTLEQANIYNQNHDLSKVKASHHRKWS